MVRTYKLNQSGSEEMDMADGSEREFDDYAEELETSDVEIA